MNTNEQVSSEDYLFAVEQEWLVKLGRRTVTGSLVIDTYRHESLAISDTSHLRLVKTA